MQAALSALPLFHELLGFRFRELSFIRELRELTRRKMMFQKFALIREIRGLFSSCSSAPFMVKFARP
jgi:hypothetical protein